MKDQPNQEYGLAPEVLASPAYQQRCDIIFELFQLSRRAGSNPFAVLETQRILADLLVEFQAKKSEFDKANNLLGVAVIKRLILILNHIADSMAWRALNYNRVLLQLLAEHPKTGHVDSTIFDDMEKAEELVNDRGALVLVNDLTTVLRHGDLTVIEGNLIGIEETKHGKASSRDRRSKRQKKTLDALLSFYRTGTRSVAGRRDYIFQSDAPVHGYHERVARIIDEARDPGYCGKELSNCLAVEALWTSDESTYFPQSRPFMTRPYILNHHNLSVFDQPTTRIAPYGIFPLDDDACFALMRGSLLLVTTLDFEALQEVYRKHGLQLVFPELSEKERAEYLSGPIEKRKKLMNAIRYTVNGAKQPLSVTPDFFGRINIELVQEDSLVRTHRQFTSIVDSLGFPDEMTSRFYTGYENEASLWR